MKLIFGLGNPGDQYANTRHNAGFLAVNYLKDHYGFDECKKAEKFYAYIAEGQIKGEKALLVKPQTFMNLSGKSVAAVANFYKVDPLDVFVIYDEADLPYETLKVKDRGQSAGHNGIKSIFANFGETFHRMRVGIKPDKPFPGALEDYVLGKLTEDEMAALQITFEKLPSEIEERI